jgi:hypothetical protein
MQKPQNFTVEYKKSRKAERAYAHISFSEALAQKESLKREKSCLSSQASLHDLTDDMLDDDLADISASISCSGYLSGELA